MCRQIANQQKQILEPIRIGSYLYELWINLRYPVKYFVAWVMSCFYFTKLAGVVHCFVFYQSGFILGASKRTWEKKYFKDSILTYFVQGLIEKPYTFIWMKNIIMISSMWFIFFTNYWTISWLKRGFFPLNSRSSTIYTLRTTREMCIIQIGHKLHRLKTVRPFLHLVPC